MSQLTVQIILFALFVLAVFSVELWVAVRIIRRREPISVISDMNKEITLMVARQRNSEKQQEISHKQILRLESLVIELDRGIKVLLAQLEKLNETPDYTQNGTAMEEIVSAAATKALEAREMALLQRTIARVFSIEEMDDMALELAIDDLPSGGTKMAKARFIIQYMVDRTQLEQLLEMVQGLRPAENWVF